MKNGWALLFLLIPALALSQGYNFVGDSYSTGDNCYVLTPNQEWQNGAIWYNQSIDLNEPYNLQFTANFGFNDAGADGLVFVLQQVGNEVLGDAGGGMGFSGFSPSFGVEFDTFQNPEVSDPPSDHLAVLTNGVNNHQSPNNLYGPISISDSSVNIEDGQDHVIDISWNPNTNEFQVKVDCILRVDLDVNLLGTVFAESSEVFWGFTGATGGFFNLQTICLDPYILGTPEQYEVCAGSSVQLEASAATFGTLNWEPAEFLDDPSSNTPIATVSETTEFTLTYEDLCNEQQIASTTVVVNNPDVDLGNDVTECAGQEVTISPEGQYDELLWSNQSTNETLNISESGTYWVEASQGECLAHDTIVVNFNPLPDWENDFVDLCEGETYTIDLSITGYDYQWFDGYPDPIRTFSEGGSYGYDLFSALGCSESFFVEVTINEIPEFDLSDTYTICQGESLNLQVDLQDADILWSTGSVSNSIQIMNEGQYWASVSDNGCEFSDTTNVFVNKVSEFEITGTESLCPDEVGELTALIEGDVSWTNGQTGNTISINLPGTYVASVVDENGCEAAASFSVQGRYLPSILLSEEIVKCQEESIRVYAESSNNQELMWSDGTRGPELITSTDGEYSVSLTNDCGTLDRTVRVQSKLCSQSFYMPNAFTPDQDGLNDIFKASVDDYEEFDLKVFNKFGQVIFHTKDPDQGWNGSYQNNGYYCQPGVYIVKYEVQFDAFNIIDGIGHVNLIR